MPTHLLQDARFVVAAHRLDQLPADEGAEVAMAGRSNAGKSSALNTLVGRKALARVSRTPGRTRQMVVFELAAQARLVDLPGYGFARVPQALREHWQQEIDAYLRQRRSLRAVVLIVDIRHPLKPFDRQMLQFCHATGLACHVLMTKADKLSRNQVSAALQAGRKLCADSGWSAGLQAFSSHTRFGLDEARETLARLLQP